MTSWREKEKYAPYSFVEYDGNIYLCVKASPVGTLPTNTDYWVKWESGGGGISEIGGMSPIFEFDYTILTDYTSTTQSSYTTQTVPNLTSVIRSNEKVAFVVKNNNNLSDGSDIKYCLGFISASSIGSTDCYSHSYLAQNGSSRASYSTNGIALRIGSVDDITFKLKYNSAIGNIKAGNYTVKFYKVTDIFN